MAIVASIFNLFMAFVTEDQVAKVGDDDEYILACIGSCSRSGIINGNRNTSATDRRTSDHTDVRSGLRGGRGGYGITPQHLSSHISLLIL